MPWPGRTGERSGHTTCNMPCHTIATLLIILLSTVSTQGACNLCGFDAPVMDAAQFESTGTLDRHLAIPGVPFITSCRSLLPFLDLLGPDSTECQQIQGVGTYCGCPIPENACRLCGEQTTNADIMAVSPAQARLQRPNNTLPFLAFLFGGAEPTCLMYESYLHSVTTTSDDCIVGQEFLSGYCGCGTDDGTDSSSNGDAANPASCSICPLGETVPDPARNITVPGFPFENCGQLQEATSFMMQQGTPQCDMVQSISSLCGCIQSFPPEEEPCSLCWDGSAITEPEKPVPWAKEVFLGVAPTCQLYEGFVNGLAKSDELCAQTQASGYHCGCPARYEDDHCVFCDGGFPTDWLQVDPGLAPPNDQVDPTTPQITLTCELLQITQYSIHHRAAECPQLSAFSYKCGCNGGDGVDRYYGAQNDTMKVVLIYIMRFASILSIIVSR